MASDGAGGELAGWLSTADAARRLGIKKETLYAYVSRGMLGSRRTAGGKESYFDPAEVTRLAARRGPGGRAGALEMAVDSGLTLLDPGGRLWYRGWDAEAACRQASFEEVAEWLWTGARTAPPPPFEVPVAVRGAAAAATNSLPVDTRPVDRMRLAVVAGALADPLRFDRRPEAVAAAARRIVALLVDSLPLAETVDGRPPPGVPADAESVEAGRGSLLVAERLWRRLSKRPVTGQGVAALNAALVLLADHEMASSTLAARVAASTWADPYLVVSAGLAILGGPLHGGVSDRLVSLLTDAAELGAEQALSGRWRVGEMVAGFGHMVYSGRDPRAEALWPLLVDAWPDHPIVVATAAVVEAVTAHGDTMPNVDLMLATLVSAADMIEGAGETIFAVARTAGWIGHAIEEYSHRLRFRFRAAYTGPPPALA
ncbi:MAG TPA: citrate synthase [Acidimicrobiales bacterium]|jgi:citrate synthase|nr:citrate synthase [Acidimicrobiales bacterium]